MYNKWTCSCITWPLSSVIPPEPVAQKPVHELAEAAVAETRPETRPVDRPTEDTPEDTPLEDMPQASEPKDTDPSSIQYIGIKVKPYLPPLPKSPKRLCETRLPSVPRFTIKQAPEGSADASRA